jgi:hypothetical protein
MLPCFSLHHFRFHLEPKAPLRMPAYNKGNVIRGGFGGTFRRVDYKNRARARVRDRERKKLWELRSLCAYTVVFHPFVPKGSEKRSKTPDIVRPFVIKPSLENRGG